MQKDVKAGYVSLELARDTYGVVLDAEKLEVDLSETERLRGQIIKERLDRGRI